ncbi:MAG: hypothetical protein WDN76_02515 [Alphaproteobacteria bacterium]
MNEAPALAVPSARADALQEYYWIQDRNEQYEGRRYEVKSWSITSSGVAFATAIMQKAPSLLLIAAVGAFVFWFIEASLRWSQHINADRGRIIEQHLREGCRNAPGAGVLPASRRRPDQAVQTFARHFPVIAVCERRAFCRTR